MKRVAFICDGRANWASISAILAHRNEAGDFVALVGSACSRMHWHDYLQGYKATVVRLPSLVDGDTPSAAAASAGVTATALGAFLALNSIDTVYLVGDRPLVLAAALVARMHNVQIAHQMGGERSGAQDDDYRDAISQLADMHLVATELAARKVPRKNGSTVLHTGCPRIDHCLALPHAQHEHAGMPVVLFHPDTAETLGDNLAYLDRMFEDLHAVWQKDYVVVWPNSDHWSGACIDRARELMRPGVVTYRHMHPMAYMHMIRDCAVLVGNSSSGIREGSYLATPVVLYGKRQRGRECGANVRPTIKAALGWKRESSDLYGDGTAGRQIGEAL